VIYGAFYFEKKYLIRRKGIIKMHYLKEYFKKSLKKNFCLLMAAAMLSSGMELPANAAELTTAAACEEELHEETESETLVEDVLEEVPEETAETIDTEEAEIESEEDTTFVEEIVDTENQTNGLTIERPSEEIGIGDPIVGGKLPNGSGSWSLTNGKLIVSGSGEYWPSTGLIAPPWYEYREQIKTARVSLRGTKSFSSFFSGCKNLTSVDFRNTDTSNATTMSNMFGDCESLEKLDLSSFNTSNVTDMSSMFYNCINLKQITFGEHFNTSNVTCMASMFRFVNLTSLDLSGFDMSKVTKADDMIYSDSLIALETPRNLNVSIPLRGTWITDQGFICTTLLQHTDKSIHLKQRPELLVGKGKKEYLVGDTLDLSDLTVTLYYNSNNRTTTTDYTTNAAQIDMNTPGTKYLVISYQGQSVTINLTVIGKSLSVSKIKKEYFVGDTLKVNDLTVELLYTNNIYPAEKITSGYTTNAASINMNTAGTKDLIVKWQNLSATVKITVKEDSYSKISVRNDIDTYYLGETLDLSELHVFAWSVSGTHTEITDYTTNAKDIDMNTVGTKQLIVSYQNFTAVSEIIIKPARTCTKLYFQNGCVFETGTKPAPDEYLIFEVLDEGKEFRIHACYYWSNIDEIDISTTGKKRLQVAHAELKSELDIYYIEAFRDDDIAHEIAGSPNEDIAYKIDKNGNLKVMGKGTCKAYGSPIWSTEKDYAKDIRTATLYVDEADDLDGLFSGCVNLRSADLSMVDAGRETNFRGMFDGCNQLVSIWTPKNVKADAALPKVEGTYWHDQNGKVYTALPKNMSTSILLTRDDIQEEESSSAIESSKVEESSSVVESSRIEETSSAIESAKVEESSSIVESSKVEENSSAVESSKVEETSSVIESSKVEENSEASENTPSEEYSEEEGASTVESSKTEESSIETESSETVESSLEQESTETDESTSEPETGRTDLNAVSGTLTRVKAKVYDQNEYRPAVKVTVVENRKKITLTEGLDYQVEYQNNVNAGTGTVLVKGIGSYKGTLKAPFTINQKSVKKLKILTGSMTTGSKSEPPVYVYDGATLLKNGTDYKLAYDAALTANAAKSAKITVTGLGNYKDSKVVKLAVYDVDEAHVINPQHVTLKRQSMEYTGKALQPAAAVKIGGTTLTANKDYKVRYQNNVNAGTAYVIITGKGAYRGEVVEPFEITALKANKTKLIIAPISDRTYSGQLQKPSVTVKSGTKKLKKDIDYTVTYTGNLHVSTAGKKAKVIITGKGNYAGLTATATFTILPQKISKASIKGTMKNLSVTYNKKQLKEGVQYKIIPDASGMKKNKTKVTITGLGDFSGSSVTKTIKIQ
jgi:surface protein